MGQLAVTTEKVLVAQDLRFILSAVACGQVSPARAALVIEARIREAYDDGYNVALRDEQALATARAVAFEDGYTLGRERGEQPADDDSWHDWMENLTYDSREAWLGFLED